MGKLSTALKEKCPRCDEGQLFEHKSYLPVSGKPFKMKKYCPNCGLKYEKEIGFFYGAMYVSYALNVALFTIILLTYIFFFKSNFGWEYFAIAYLLLTFILTGVIFRLSRSFWMAMLTKNDPGVRDEKNLILATAESQVTA